MFDVKNVSLYYVDKLANTPITVKVPSGRTFDNTTNKMVESYTEYQIKALVRNITFDTISHSNNWLTQEAKNVIFKADMDLTSDSVIVIGGKEYRIKQISVRNGYYVLVVDER